LNLLLSTLVFIASSRLLFRVTSELSSVLFPAATATATATAGATATATATATAGATATAIPGGSGSGGGLLDMGDGAQVRGTVALEWHLALLPLSLFATFAIITFATATFVPPPHLCHCHF
jgi:hypothetical protein